ncbi:FtsK/SpoIIIE domain-containing protein [Nonomuraea endophytica]|uniref:S-DNA-T family DNA segregation ATPase FtsK/SpoIIIE n=1 Tax=Nonomuraea endophytica TaxID=714136 RepID=A0A7W8EDN9_9ACTN|nr:FtsK/SpoIIIE domain-containing protein [Nonomuraea endophytica]MBB5076750.1 S-DNA-T family DNA segregation ATPase FtsK/SpoIIIE [Nonomuraea endophytica]
MEREILVETGGRAAAVVIRAGAQATVADLAGALALSADARLRADGAELAGSVPLSRAPLPVGARLTTGPAEGTARPPDDGFEVAVIGGAAGTARAMLPPDIVITLGRAPDNALALEDPEVSRHHATLTAAAGGSAELADAGSRNGVAWHGVRLGAPATVTPGEPFGMGETVLTVRPVDPADAPLHPASEDGSILLNRPPRLPIRQPVLQLNLPRRPQEPRTIRFPLIAILLPLVLAGAVYLIFPGAAYFLAFAALSPILMVANLVSDRRGGRRDYKTACAEYDRERAALLERLATAAAEQGRAARDAAPDPGRTLRIATGPTSRLYERRRDDTDFLRLRLGLAVRPVDVSFTGATDTDEPEIPLITHAPVTVSLAQAGVLGLAGPRESMMPTVRAALAHLAVLHAPHDLGLLIVTGQDDAAGWEWATWLPHTLPHLPELACRRMIAVGAEQAATRLAELRRMLAERQAEQRATLRDGLPKGRSLILVADGARRLRSVPGLAELLTEGPELGVYAICLDTDENHLPAECRTTVVATGDSGTRARVRSRDEGVETVLLDRLAEADAARLSSALAPIRVLGGTAGAEADLPDSVRLLDLLGLGPDPCAEAIERGWTAGRSSRVTLGVGPDGPVVVDVKRDGPHALIAGTSGAGKSELLQTLIAGLAVANSPVWLSMVLIDYKGGSAFSDCRDLPHCVGMVTDLDGHLSARALESLAAELRRREELLAEAGAKDIEDYWARAGRPLARLVIVIDEFATLVEEVPEFVSGVAGIGMRGRSLGVHVILATQRPAGAVSADLRANLNLRVCLRVTSSADSGDVIDVPDAARLSRRRPGRAYLRSGHSDLELLQTARVGGPWAGADEGDREVTIRPRIVADLGATPAGPAEEEMGHDGETDLSRLVAAIREAARHSGAALPASPWLPPLPEQVRAADLPDLPDAPGAAPIAVRIGLADHPGRQEQRPYVLDLRAAGTVLVAGMARSGRSTALRAMAAELARRNSPAELHLYVLDQGNGALAAVRQLPHCGAYVDADDLDRAERVIALLTAELGRRQRLMAESRVDGLPYLLLMVDRYEGLVARFADTDGGRLVDALDGLLRHGPSAGIGVVLASDRSGFTHRLSGAVAVRIVLRHADPGDAAVYGLNPKLLPSSMPEGRAVVVPGEVEVQLTLPLEEPAMNAQGVPAAALPKTVDPLPERISLDELDRLRCAPPPRGVAVCTIGVGGDRLAPQDIDLAEVGHRFMIAGPPGSGRSAALMAVARSLTSLPLVLVCPRRSPLSELAGRPGVEAVLSGMAEAERLAEVLTGPCAVLVDDAELLADRGCATVLEELARTVRDDGGVLVAAGTTDDLQLQRYRGWLATLRRGRAGLLLTPGSPVDGELLDVKLARPRGLWPPGRGILVIRGRQMPIQVPVHETAFAR